MTEYVLREFKCKECGHMVVVNPELPADYTPDICKQCVHEVIEPRERAETMRNVQQLLTLLGHGE